MKSIWSYYLVMLRKIIYLPLLNKKSEYQVQINDNRIVVELAGACIIFFIIANLQLNARFTMFLCPSIQYANLQFLLGWEVAADIQTVKQYSRTGSMNDQRRLASTVISLKTLIIVFLKIPTFLEAEAAIALTCFSKANLESIMTPKIFNSENISTTEQSMTKSGNKGSTAREREISIPLVLLGFTSIPHLLHQSLIIDKSSFLPRMWNSTKQGRVVSITNKPILEEP